MEPWGVAERIVAFFANGFTRGFFAGDVNKDTFVETDRRQGFSACCIGEDVDAGLSAWRAGQHLVHNDFELTGSALRRGRWRRVEHNCGLQNVRIFARTLQKVREPENGTSEQLAEDALPRQNSHEAIRPHQVEPEREICRRIHQCKTCFQSILNLKRKSHCSRVLYRFRFQFRDADLGKRKTPVPPALLPDLAVTSEIEHDLWLAICQRQGNAQDDQVVIAFRKRI